MKGIDIQTRSFDANFSSPFSRDRKCKMLLRFVIFGVRKYTLSFSQRSQGGHEADKGSGSNISQSWEVAANRKNHQNQNWDVLPQIASRLWWAPPLIIFFPLLSSTVTGHTYSDGDGGDHFITFQRKRARAASITTTTCSTPTRWYHCHRHRH